MTHCDGCSDDTVLEVFLILLNPYPQGSDDTEH